VQIKIGIGSSDFHGSIKSRFTEEPIKLFETFQEIPVRNERGTSRTDIGHSGTPCSDPPLFAELDRPLLDRFKFLSKVGVPYRRDMLNLPGSRETIENRRVPFFSRHFGNRSFIERAQTELPLAPLGLVAQFRSGAGTFPLEEFPSVGAR